MQGKWSARLVSCWIVCSAFAERKPARLPEQSSTRRMLRSRVRPCPYEIRKRVPALLKRPLYQQVLHQPRLTLRLKSR
jgi:hypothetical protein